MTYDVLDIAEIVRRLLGQPSSRHATSIAFAVIHCNEALHSVFTSLHQLTRAYLGKRLLVS
jgi:hypothetical protein